MWYTYARMPFPQSTLSVPSTSASNNSPTNIYEYPSVSTPEVRSIPALFSHSFPFTPLGTPVAVQGLIESHLPSRAIASQLVETYLAHVLWLFHGVSRTQLLEDMLPVVYRRQELQFNTGAGENEIHGGMRTSAVVAGVDVGDEHSGPHDLALLFIVFAIGVLMRPTNDPNSPLHSNSVDGDLPAHYSNVELGEHFHQLSCAALALQPVLERPASVTIQTLYLMSVYNSKSGSALRSEVSMEMTWGLTTLAAHLAQTVSSFFCFVF